MTFWVCRTVWLTVSSLVPEIFGKEKGCRSTTFSLPFSWVILFYHHRWIHFKPNLLVSPHVIQGRDTLPPAWRSRATDGDDAHCNPQTICQHPGAVPSHARSRAGRCPHTSNSATTVPQTGCPSTARARPCSPAPPLPPPPQCSRRR